jgi:long-chain acyl-CoA synthetase
MQPGDHVSNGSDRPAAIMATSGLALTYSELDARSKQLAQLFYDRGLRPGDHIAILLENHPRYFEVYWAAQRSGLYSTPINWHLTPAESGYIIEDCGATALVTSAALGPIASQLEPYLSAVTTRLAMDGPVAGFEAYESEVARYPAEPLALETEGMYMFYSSGTTGRPKGIMRALDGAPFGSGGGSLTGLIQQLFGFTADTVYLSPAPLYHAAPLGWTTSVQRLGGTAVIMEKFEPEQVLALIEKHRITHAQFVPTHFVRLLKLPAEVRARYELSSLQMVVHAAAPCPVEVKQQMLAWWGPVIHEFYAGSEGNGFCYVGPEDWLTHPGTVGRSLLGPLHILGDDGVELPTGEAGQIWFESGVAFEYHNDPAKTAGAYNDRGWSGLGDIGYLDAEGYLFLTDRVSHMIISGGVNIYPQEVENLLTMHPAILDVAVIGVPNDDLGEEVKAVVLPADPAAASPALAAEIIAYCRQHLAHYKCPVTVDFVDELPRLPTGKLLKRELRARYTK